MAIKLLIICTLYWGIGLLFGCKKSACDDQVFKYYTCYKVKLQNIQYQWDDDSIISNYQNTSDTVHASNYGISMIFDVEKFAQKSDPIPFSFITSAYAGDCISYRMEIMDRIKKVSIYTVYDFNKRYYAGSLISEAFQYVQQSKFKKQEYETIDEFLKRDDYFHIEEYSYGLFAPLHLNEVPSTDTKIQFKVIISFESGREMTTYTREVFMNR